MKTIRQSIRASSGLATLLAFSVSAHAAPVSFFDGTFNLANYTIAIFSSDPSVTITPTQTLTGGNPGAALSITYTNSGGSVALESYQGFIDTGFNYTPSVQGALGSIDFSNDRYIDVGPVLNPSITPFSRLLVQQAGVYFFARVADGPARGAWETTSASGLGAPDFSAFDFATGVVNAALHPDFSTTGAAIGFGVANRFTLNTGGAPFQLDGLFQFDNYSVSINPAAAQLPEPPTGWLMLAVMPAAIWFARRRNGRTGDAKSALA